MRLSEFGFYIKEIERLFDCVTSREGFSWYEGESEWSDMPKVTQIKEYNVDMEKAKRLYNDLISHCDGLSKESLKEMYEQPSIDCYKLVEYKKALQDVLLIMDKNYDINNFNNEDYYIILSNERFNNIRKVIGNFKYCKDRMFCVPEDVLHLCAGSNKIIFFKAQDILSDSSYTCDTLFNYFRVLN